MKITQKRKTKEKFIPIKIILETQEEVATIWDALEERRPENDYHEQIKINLCNWFTHQMHM